MSVTSSFFLGPGLGRWTPSSWAELEQAIADGTLNETTWVELKKQISPGRHGSLELARDLASLALRSGLLVIGVSEVSRGVAGEIHSVDLAHDRDRVVQVAANTVTPSVYVQCREIVDPEIPGRGVLLVGVPASGPHMADDRYWGRTDVGKIPTPLSDPEVREHLARRRLAEDDVLDQVRELATVALREGAGEESGAPWLYVRAVPTAGRRDAMRDFLVQSNGGGRIHALLAQVVQQRPGPADASESELERASFWGHYARGRTLSLSSLATPPDGTDTVLRLEDNGALDLIHGPVGGHHTRPYSSTSQPTVHTGRILSAVHDTVGLAGRLADLAAYPGEWIIAVHVDVMEGRQDGYTASHGTAPFQPVYTGQPDYADATTTTTSELVEQPWAVAGRLLSRLVHALGADKVYLPYEPDSAGLAMTNK